MPRNRKRKIHVPTLSHHKASGRARVRINGHDNYCGPWGSAEAQETYRRFVAEWLQTGDVVQSQRNGSADGPLPLSVNELILAYYRYCETYYVKNGKPTSELRMVRDSLRVVKDHYGMLPADKFGPLKLKSVRDEMIRLGWCRPQVNKQVGRIKRCFRWGVESELVPQEVYGALQAVAGLRKGRTEARESKPVMPVDEHVVNMTLPHLSPVVADMVRIQLLTGCRPVEVCTMRPCDVNRDGDVWEHVPESHKTEHHGRKRIVFIGPKAQAILLRYLDNRPSDMYCFSPAEAIAQRRVQMRQDRKTPVQPSQWDRSVKQPAKQPGDRYSTMSYGKAIKAACEKSMPTIIRKLGLLPKAQRDRARQLRIRWRVKHVWSPNQLRHARVTNLRRDYGIEAAQVVLGHSDALLTATVYAERDFDAARRIMAEVG